MSIAVQHLIELTGASNIPPLAGEIAKMTIKHFPIIQKAFAPLETELKYLNLPGCDTAKNIQNGIAKIIMGDGSDAAFRLGKKDSDLFVDITWAKKVQKAIDNGLKKTVQDIRKYENEVKNLPDTEGVMGQLKTDLSTHFDNIARYLATTTFHEKTAELKDELSIIESKINQACSNFEATENKKMATEVQKIKGSYDWNRLSDEIGRAHV